MAKSDKIREARLAEIEAEFHALLVTCLRECARGRYGLFGQNDRLDPEGTYWGWAEAKRLKQLALEIQTMRLEFGLENETCERFFQLCALRGPNIPGEPKLAADFLKEIGHN
jgi:hypothetical protein